MAENKGVLPSSNVNTLGNANNKWENVYANKFTGTVAGNAATATALQTARSINGTNFNGTGNITTANWGTARNISIADATAANTGTGVSVNGSGNVTLKLPATIKAALTGNVTGNVSGSSSSCTGNAATATKATQDSAGQQINTTYIKGLSVSGATLTITKGNGTTSTATINQTAGILPATRVLQGGGTKLYSCNGGLAAGDITLSQAFTNFKYLVIFSALNHLSEDLRVSMIETAALYQAMAGNATYWPGNVGASAAHRVWLVEGWQHWSICNLKGGSSTTYLKQFENNNIRLFSIYGIN